MSAYGTLGKLRKEVISGTTAAGTGAITSDVVDTANAESFTFDVILTSGLISGVSTLKLQGGAESDGSDMADLTGASVAYTYTAGSTTPVIQTIELTRPLDRYVRAVCTRATANIAVGAITCYASGVRVEPVTGDDVISDGGVFASPST